MAQGEVRAGRQHPSHPQQPAKELELLGQGPGPIACMLLIGLAARDDFTVFHNQATGIVE